ncbi:MAG: stage II sporulation protein M [Acidobacteria bacterium]|nr:stage II sporulation protein M [Acidobacteriota bacterium]
MIIDLPRFIAEERAHWTRLESILDKLESEPEHRLDLAGLKSFHLLYERTSADLAKVATFASEPELLRYLESLVARAYGEIHETRDKAHRLAPRNWLLRTLPQTFRRRVGAFWLAVAITLLGCGFGGIAIQFDSEAREVLMPFGHAQQDPRERVATEESADKDRLEGQKSQFSAWLMTHNIRVSVFTFGLGITFGLGTIIMLFFNGAVLGAVAVDYVLAGETQFLLGWLLPHGVVEIPAILIAGQAGLVLARALIGSARPVGVRERLREASADLVTLIAGVAILLVWAGIVEAFLSQYHEPFVPYWLKIAFGIVELCVLGGFLAFAGRAKAA